MLRGIATTLLRTVVVSVVAAVTLGASNAHANPLQTAGKGEKHCIITLDKLQPGQTESRVISHECVFGDQQPVTAQGDYLLMVWYQHKDYYGASTSIKGVAPCDNAGYGISDTGYWREFISSYKVFNRCNTSRMFTLPKWSGTGSGVRYSSQRYLGSTFNDNVGSFWIWNT